MRSNSIGFGILILTSLPACGGSSSDLLGEGDVTMAEESLEAYGVIEFLNGPAADLNTLDNVVGLDARAARNIVAHVRGPDAILGTADDDLLQTVAELDDIPYVGGVAIEKLTTYVAAIGEMPTLVVEGVSFTDAQATAVLDVANTATQDVLDVQVGLDSRAATAIVAARPIATIESLAAVSYVGNQALTKLKTFATLSKPAIPHDGGSTPDPDPTTEPTSTHTPVVPIPFVLEWINDYQGEGHVTRLNLLRTGAYEATVAGQAETGVYYGPATLAELGVSVDGIPLQLFAADGTAWTAKLTMYSSTSAIVQRDGQESTLHATLQTDGEDACDSSEHAQYLDDDANSDGLYCQCDDGYSWIPALGGCVQ